MSTFMPGRTMLLAGLLGCLSLGAAAEPAAFRDDFDSLDEDRWYVSDGWSNGDWHGCTWSRQLLDVSDGQAVLSIAPSEEDPSDYLCAEIQTSDRFHYGTFEARLRTDRASGANAAFFTYIGPVHDKPHDEIDVEILTRDPALVSVNTYTDGESAEAVEIPIPGAPADEEFHTYSFIWEPDRLRWFVDGAFVHEMTGDDVPQTPQKIYLSYWNTLTLTDWMGEFEDPGRPLDMRVDWVAYTPLGEDCGFEGSVLCELEDTE